MATTSQTESGRPIVKLIVSNISPLATEEELAAFILRIAPYERFHLIRNMHHGLSARFAFLDVAPHHEATIRDRLDSAMFMDRPLGVLSVLSRPDRPGRDGV